MGSLRLGSLVCVFVTILLLCFLPACGGHKPAGASPFPARINLNPSTSYSIQAGTTVQFSATAQNSSNSTITPAFTFTSTNSSIVDIAPGGVACAGTWNAPLYTVCTPNGFGVAQVTASAGNNACPAVGRDLLVVGAGAPYPGIANPVAEIVAYEVHG